MSPQDAAERKRLERARRRKAGFEKLELWEPSENHEQIKRYAERLRNKRRDGK